MTAHRPAHNRQSRRGALHQECHLPSKGHDTERSLWPLRYHPPTLQRRRWGRGRRQGPNPPRPRSRKANRKDARAREISRGIAGRGAPGERRRRRRRRRATGNNRQRRCRGGRGKCECSGSACPGCFSSLLDCRREAKATPNRPFCRFVRISVAHVFRLLQLSIPQAMAMVKISDPRQRPLRRILHQVHRGLTRRFEGLIKRMSVLRPRVVPIHLHALHA
jgi:hypothetical protein